MNAQLELTIVIVMQIASTHKEVFFAFAKQVTQEMALLVQVSFLYALKETKNSLT